MSQPNLSLEGKTAIITGAGKGIGRILAAGFAQAGASVVLVSRTASDLDSLAQEIRSRNGEALPFPADITEAEQVSHMVGATQKEFGRIDVLVNCAGGAGARPFIPLLEMEEKDWDRVLNLNLRAVYLCCRAAGRVMAEQRSGSIINVSSGAGTAPVPGETHYGAAKAGVNQLTRVLAVELGKYQVRVNAISPGLIATRTSRDFLSPEVFEIYAKAIPLGRAGEPEDILGLALFLASEASGYISGTIIPVGGGPQ